MDRRAEKAEITSEMVIAEIGKLAFADIRKVFNEHGQLLPIHELPDEIAASVSSIEVVTSRVPGGEPAEVEHTAKIKFWDKRGSLELLGKHMKLFTDKVESQNTNHNINQDAGEIDMTKLSGAELEALTSLLKKAAK